MQSKLREKLREMKDCDRTPGNFRALLNNTLLQTFPSAPDSISERTATTRWLTVLGFYTVTAGKGWFTDHHERKDNVRDR